jgi:molybdate transport system substrate-binding protein
MTAWPTNQPAYVSKPMLLAIISLPVAAVLVGLLASSPRHGADSNGQEPLILYCAAGLVKPIKQIARDYEEEFGQAIQLELGGSGKLLSQISLTRGRGHLYLAADSWYIDQARSDGLVGPSFSVARITPVIVTQRGNPKNITSLNDLSSGHIKLVLANPDLASIGRTGKVQLQAAGLWEQLQRLRAGPGAIVSMVGTVNQVAQAVQLATADAGIVWDVTAAQFDLPFIHDERLDAGQSTIAIAVLQDQSFTDDAMRFVRYLSDSETGRGHLRAYGFTPMDAVLMEQANDE